jgi:hypothetical protein
MAVIEYMINVDVPNGNAIVNRVIVQFGPGIADKIRFRSNQSDTAIEFVGDCPFDANDPQAPQKNKSFLVSKGPTAAFEVKGALTHFRCGHEKSPGVFIPWGGGGGGTPPDDN